MNLGLSHPSGCLKRLTFVASLSGGHVRVPTAIHAGILGALLLAGFARPAGAQPPPPPPPARPAAPVGQAGQPRDPGRRPPAEPVGTGVIRGMVVAADTGTPIRPAPV